MLFSCVFIIFYLVLYRNIIQTPSTDFSTEAKIIFSQLIIFCGLSVDMRTETFVTTVKIMATQKKKIGKKANTFDIVEFNILLGIFLERNGCGLRYILHCLTFSSFREKKFQIRIVQKMLNVSKPVKIACKTLKS